MWPSIILLKNILHRYPPLKFTSTVSNCWGLLLFSSKIYIQFTIFNTYFSTKLLFTIERYHLHVLEKYLYVLQEVRSIIYVWQFIHPLSLCSCGNGTSFAFMSYIILSTKFCKVTFLSNFYFVSFIYHLFICWHQRKITLVTLSKNYIYKFFF